MLKKIDNLFDFEKEEERNKLKDKITNSNRVEIAEMISIVDRIVMNAGIILEIVSESNLIQDNEEYKETCQTFFEELQDISSILRICAIAVLKNENMKTTGEDITKFLNDFIEKSIDINKKLEQNSSNPLCESEDDKGMIN